MTTQAKVQGGKAPTTQAKAQGGKAHVTQAKVQGGKAPATQAKVKGRKAPTTQAKVQGGKAPTTQAKAQGGKAHVTQAKVQGGKAPATQAKVKGRKAPTTQAKAQGGKAFIYNSEPYIYEFSELVEEKKTNDLNRTENVISRLRSRPYTQEDEDTISKIRNILSPLYKKEMGRDLQKTHSLSKYNKKDVVPCNEENNCDEVIESLIKNGSVEFVSLINKNNVLKYFIMENYLCNEIIPGKKPYQCKFNHYIINDGNTKWILKFDEKTNEISIDTKSVIPSQLYQNPLYQNPLNQN